MRKGGLLDVSAVLRSPGRASTGRRGIVLLLVVSMFVMLMLLCLSLLQFTSLLGRQSRVALGSARSGLAAASGMEYAAARLYADPQPRHFASIERRGGSWTCRDDGAASLWALRNPSYSHGENWEDDLALASDGADNDADGLADEEDEQAGAYCTAEGAPPFGWDLDADGGFTAWSGRLRGGDRPFELTFTLRVTALSGLFPLNAGYLDAQDRDPFPPLGTAPDPNGVPDHRDFWETQVILPAPTDVFGRRLHPYHIGLLHALNNLGAILLPETGTGRQNAEAGNSGDPDNWFQISTLGYDLLTVRPEGGYKTLDEVDDVLSAAGYTPTERAKIVSYLDLGPYDRPGEGARASGPDLTDPPPYVPVNFLTAPREILAALWMYQAASPPYDDGTARLSLPWEAAADVATSARTASATFPELAFLIFQDEAGRLADALIDLRRNGTEPLSWNSIYRRFVADAPGIIFVRDALDLSGNPEALRSWMSGKAELAFAVASEDPFPFPEARPEATDGNIIRNLKDAPIFGAPAAATWGMDRDPMTALPELYSPGLFPWIRRIPYPASYPAIADPPVWTFDPYARAPGSPAAFRALRRTHIRPEGGTLAPPDRFRIESAGRSARALRTSISGTLRSAETVCFTSQEDFENLSGSPALAGRGIRADGRGTRAPAKDAIPATDIAPAEVREYRPVVSLPRFNQESVGTACYSRTYGALALATRECGLRGAQLYWPFSEDAVPDGDPANNFSHDPASPWGSPPGPIPVSTDLFTRDNECLTPFWVGPTYSNSPSSIAGGNQFSLSFPWDDGGGSGIIQRFTIETWLKPYSRLYFMPSYPAGQASPFDLSVWRVGGPDPEMRGTMFTFWARWYGSPAPPTPPPPPNPQPPPNEYPTGQYFFTDDDTAGDPWGRHFALTVERRDVGGGVFRTLVRIFIDGSNLDPEFGLPMEWWFNPWDWFFPYPDLVVVPSPVFLLSEGFDEIRFYNVALDDDQVLNRFNLGRFVSPASPATYLSPRYILDEDASFNELQWTGIIPPTMADTAVRVNLYGYDKDDNGVWANPRPVGATSGQVESLAGLPRVRSFRYEVLFDPALPADMMRDTPVFESIRLSFQRPGRSGWSAWARQ